MSTDSEHQPVNGAAARQSESAGPGGQVTALVSKLFELADAGVGLGINVITLLSSYTQHQMKPDQTPETPPAAPPQTGPSAQPPPESPAERSYSIVNRMPLHPGSSVRVSFSISNERPDTVRRLRISVLGFTGATTGATLPTDFTVESPEREIGPMDFERFVLSGSIPADAPTDSYAGWVLVEGDEQMRIPVMLLVSPVA